ncbi:MAG: Snf7 family protein, partial [Candidatus Heimdallarchaeota archaeon]|nr:Snf7 family protein [Candidatus Heimdallarchaeota archaeon]MCK5050072.1 Snf7 family protein [Candidatus Heimdallarchaeota archaeon]
MGRIKNWLFGDSSSDKEGESTTKLKSQLNRLELESKNLKRQSEEQKELAAQMLENGNRNGAKQALQRRSIYMNRLNQMQNQLMNITSMLDSIQTVRGTAEVVTAMKSGTEVIDETLSEVSEVDAERTMIEAESQMDRIATMTEALSDTTFSETMGLDVDDIDNIDAELDAMEA